MQEPNVTMQYLGTEHPYSPSTYTARAWSHTWYHRIFQVPLSEMLSRGSPEVPLEAALADELVRYTAAQDWVQQYKRPLRVGDTFQLGETNWLFCTTKDQKAMETAGIKTIALKGWQDILIAQIPEPV